MKMNKMTILEKLGMIDKQYVMEADNAYDAAASEQNTREKTGRKILDWFSHGWGVAMICMLVAGGVFAAILYAGQNPPDVIPPAGTKQEESTAEEVTEPMSAETSPETEPAETTEGDTEEVTAQEPETQDPKVSEILALAPAWNLPAEGRIVSENAFMTRYPGEEGEPLEAVMRTAILETDANTKADPLYFLADLLDEEGKVISSTSTALPNVNGRVIYVEPNGEEEAPYQGIGKFVILGAQVNNILRPLAPGERFIVNLILSSTAFCWNNPSINPAYYMGFVGSQAFERNDMWDAELVQSLQGNANFSGKLTEMKDALTALMSRATVIADTKTCYTPQTGKALDEAEISALTGVTPEDLYTFFHKTYGTGSVPPLEITPKPTEFTLTFDGGKLTGYEGGEPPAELVIPSTTPDGTPVTVLGMNCFSGCNTIRSVVIPDTVHTMDGGVFRDCDNLENVTIPAGLKFLYSYVFSGTKIKEIILPKGCQYVDIYALAEMDCDYVELWAEDIPQEVFANSKIKNLVLREGVKRLNHQPKLEVENLYFPKSIELMAVDYIYVAGKYYFEGTESEWESKNYHMEQEVIFEADPSDLKP